MCTPVLGWRGGRPVQRSGPVSGSRSLTEIVRRVPSGPRTPGSGITAVAVRCALPTPFCCADPADGPAPEPYRPPTDPGRASAEPASPGEPLRAPWVPLDVTDP